MNTYMPEGMRINTAENINYFKNPSALQTAKEQGIILEGIAVSCDAEHNLIVDINGKKALYQEKNVQAELQAEKHEI